MITDIAPAKRRTRAMETLITAKACVTYKKKRERAQVERDALEQQQQQGMLGGGFGGGGSMMSNMGGSASTIRSNSSRAGSSRGGGSRGSSGQRPEKWMSKMKETTILRSSRPCSDLSAPVLDIRCMATIPVAVVTCGDGGRDGLETVTTKLYDLVSGEVMG